MTLFLISALAAAIVTAVILRWLIIYAVENKKFMPAIRPRDSHTSPVPRVGGVAMTIGFLAVLIILQIIRPEALIFSGEKILGIDRNLIGLLLAILILSVVNIIDDLRGVSWSKKLLSQVIGAACISFFGVVIHTLSSPTGEQLSIGSISWLLVVVWLVAISNVVNWLDSIDGVAGGVSAIAFGILFFLSISPEVDQPANALLAALGFGAVVGFLPFNLKSKVFMGDTGSMFLGFLIGVSAIISGGKVATTFLVLAIPFLDAVVVFIRRIMEGQPPFLADRRHLIHRLLDMGMKKWQIILLFWVTSLVFGLIALNTQTVGKFWAVLAAMILMGLLVMVYSFQGKGRGNERTKH